MANAHNFRRHRLKMSARQWSQFHNFALTNSDFENVFLDNIFSWRRIFVKLVKLKENDFLIKIMQKKR